MSKKLSKAIATHNVKDTDLWAYAMLIKLVREQGRFIEQVSPALKLLGSPLTPSTEPEKITSVLRISETLLLDHFKNIQDPNIKALIEKLF